MSNDSLFTLNKGNSWFFEVSSHSFFNTYYNHSPCMYACTPFLGMQWSPAWWKLCMHSSIFMHVLPFSCNCMHLLCACTLFIYAWTCMQMCQITCMIHACNACKLQAWCRYEVHAWCMHASCMHSLEGVFDVALKCIWQIFFYLLDQISPMFFP